MEDKPAGDTPCQGVGRSELPVKDPKKDFRIIGACRTGDSEKLAELLEATPASLRMCVVHFLSDT